MKLVKVVPSASKSHKYTATFESKEGKKKVTHFGAKGYDDYTITGSKQQKERYQQRHEKDLQTKDPTRAGYLSYYLLWNKPTLASSIKDYKRRFNM